MAAAALLLCCAAAAASAAAASEPTAVNMTCARHGAAPGEPGAIPRKLHAIWWPGQAHLPAHLKPSLSSWLQHHPGWETFVWGETQVRDLVTKELGWLSPAWKRVSAVGRRDLARYVILYHLGGLVVELDVHCLRPFDAPLAGHGLVLFEPREDLRARAAGPSPALLAATPAHPLLRRVLDATPEEGLGEIGGARLAVILARCEALEANATVAARAEGGTEHATCAAADGSCARAAAPEPECGCRSAYPAAPYFMPFDPALSTDGQRGPEEQVEAMRAFAARLADAEFPPAGAYAVQYATDTWLASANSAAAALVAGVSRARGLRAGAAAAAATSDGGSGDGAAAGGPPAAEPEPADPVSRAMQMFEPLAWYWWGERYKYPPSPALPAPGSGGGGGGGGGRAAPKPDVKKAQRAYTRATELLPNFAAAHFELGNILREKRRLRLALDEYAKAQAADPSNYMYSNNLGLVQLHVGRAADAEVNFKAALALFERGAAPAVDTNAKAGAMENIARALEAQGKPEEALPLYRQVARTGTAAHQRSVAPRILALEGKEKRMPVDVGQEALKRAGQKKTPLTPEELQEVKRTGAVKFAERVFGGRRAAA